MEFKICVPLHVAFDEYAANVPSVYNSTDIKSAQVHFRDLLLQTLPVLIVEARSLYVLLIEKPLESITLCKGINTILEDLRGAETGISKHSLILLASLFPVLKKMLTSSKDLAIIYSILSLLLSRTLMNQFLGTSETFASRLHKETLEMTKEAEKKEVEAEDVSNKYVEELIKKLSKDLEQGQETIERKRKFELENKRRRLEKLETDTGRAKLKKRKRWYILSSWKSGLRKQTGKGKGKARIDRSAETAVYNVLYEQLQAHDRRWGEEGTGYIEGKRIQGRELRKIANEHLKSKGLPLIKNLETVRSWGKPKNKRSRQAQQHRGRGLWKSKRAEKERADRHVNIHFNRAHVKNYTRLIFKKNSPYKRFSVRRAMDDKAYLRCGTSEGFGRPIHTPVQLSGENLQFKLPSSDYPQECGYVSPGVILLVNNMKEVKYNETDRYVKDDVTVTVTCKPKLVYPSTATNWFNDLYRIRYLYSEEHEIEATDSDETPEPASSSPQENHQFQQNASTSSKASSTDDQVTKQCLSVIRDSLFQFEMMNVKDDFVRATEGGDHQRRELLRFNVLVKRINKFIPVIVGKDLIQRQVAQLQNLLDTLQKLKGNYLIFIFLTFVTRVYSIYLILI